MSILAILPLFIHVQRRNHWRWLSGSEEGSTCLHQPSPPALDHVETHWSHSQPNLKNSVWKRCHSTFIRQKFPFPVPQRSTLLRSTAMTASCGFHTREKGMWQKLLFVSGMKPVESVLQPFCWFLVSHPSWCWECIGQCNYQLQRKCWLKQPYWYLNLLYAQTVPQSEKK